MPPFFIEKVYMRLRVLIFEALKAFLCKSSRIEEEELENGSFENDSDGNDPRRQEATLIFGFLKRASYKKSFKKKHSEPENGFFESGLYGKGPKAGEESRGLDLKE